MVQQKVDSSVNQRVLQKVDWLDKHWVEPRVEKWVGLGWK
jgi:hypothetical protein